MISRRGFYVCHLCFARECVARSFTALDHSLTSDQEACPTLSCMCNVVNAVRASAADDRRSMIALVCVALMVSVTVIYDGSYRCALSSRENESFFGGTGVRDDNKNSDLSIVFPCPKCHPIDGHGVS